MSSIFSEETLALKPIANKALAKSGHQFYGQDAIAKVEELEGTLSEEEKRIVSLEGFVDVPYLDSEGNWTIGAGLSKKFKDSTFKEAFVKHRDRAAKSIKGFDELPELLRAELIQAEYRGDLGQSKKFREKFNKARTMGDYILAAEEFLDNKDYRKSRKKGTGIADRMQAVADAVVQYGFEAPLNDTQGDVRVAIQSNLKPTNVAQTGSQELREPITEPTDETVAFNDEDERVIQQMMNELQGISNETNEVTDTQEFSEEDEQIIQQMMQNGVVQRGPAFQEAEPQLDETDLIERIYG